MKILFATAQPFPPQMFGGLQMDIIELAGRLRARGHDTAIFCGLAGSGWTGFRGRVMMKISRKPYTKDGDFNHKTYRAWFPKTAMKDVADDFHPDIVVVAAREPVPIALAVRAIRIPVVMLLQDVEFHDHGGDFKALVDVPCVANSSYTAEKYKRAFSVTPHVIYPIIDSDKYRVVPQKKYVLFVNPHPFKGVEIACDVAQRLPHIPFVFLESWPLSKTEDRALTCALKNLPNVIRHAPVKDMKPFYAGAKMILVPSRWEEAFGRIVAEAQVSGIPAISTRRAGLIESTGPGGILIDFDAPIENWTCAVENLWDDEMLYGALSVAARKHAERPDMNPDQQIRTWENILKKSTGYP